MSLQLKDEKWHYLAFSLKCFLPPPPHLNLPSSLCVSVGRQTTAPASVSAVAGTPAGIVEQGKLVFYHPLSD